MNSTPATTTRGGFLPGLSKRCLFQCKGRTVCDLNYMKRLHPGKSTFGTPKWRSGKWYVPFPNWVILRFAAVNFQGCIGWRMEFLFLSPVQHANGISKVVDIFWVWSFGNCEGLLCKVLDFLKESSFWLVLSFTKQHQDGKHSTRLPIINQYLWSQHIFLCNIAMENHSLYFKHDKSIQIGDFFSMSIFEITISIRRSCTFSIF